MKAGVAQQVRVASKSANDAASIEPVWADVGTVAGDLDVAVAAAIAELGGEIHAHA